MVTYTDPLQVEKQNVWSFPEKPFRDRFFMPDQKQESLVQRSVASFAILPSTMHQMGWHARCEFGGRLVGVCKCYPQADGV